MWNASKKHQLKVIINIKILDENETTANFKRKCTYLVIKFESSSSQILNPPPIITYHSFN